MVTKKPWGFEKIIEQNDLYVVKELHLKPNSRLSLQYHEKKTETMMLIEGQAWLLRESKEAQLPWSANPMLRLRPHYIKNGWPHRLSTRDSSAIVVEVSSTELNDLVRLEDDYGRII